MARFYVEPYCADANSATGLHVVIGPRFERVRDGYAVLDSQCPEDERIVALVPGANATTAERIAYVLNEDI